jgi:sugar (pentulose or hexulose) kinase
MELVIGLDLGTQGVRALAVDKQGKIAAHASAPLRLTESSLPAGWHQQDAEDWWQAVCTCLQQLCQSLPQPASIAALSVTSTSGTLLAVDRNGVPLYPAMMYNDERSQPYVEQVRQAGVDLEKRLGYAFNATYALSKIVWLAKEQSQVFQKAQYFISPTDFLVGRLSGKYGISDHSNMLKTGFDLIKREWPGFISDELGIPSAVLPQVISPGEKISQVSAYGSRSSGLTRGLPVIAGATDGVASHIASGAVEPGSWNSTLGTTLVIKGISPELLLDPQQRIYSHRHPEGWWMPGGASNTGAEWITVEFPADEPAKMDQLAKQYLPTRLIRYPLVRVGERFPFRHSQATGFWIGEPETEAQAFAAGLEGLALVERLAYETLQEIGASVGERIYVTGGGAKSEVWLRIRASMLQKTLCKPQVSETAMGAALLAARGIWFGSLQEAVQNMVNIEGEITPQTNLIEPYQEKYQAFIKALVEHGYIVRN